MCRLASLIGWRKYEFLLIFDLFLIRRVSTYGFEEKQKQHDRDSHVIPSRDRIFVASTVFAFIFQFTQNKQK